MRRRRRRSRRGYERSSTGVVINADRVIIPSEEDEPPMGLATSLKDMILGAVAGMMLLRLIDIGRTIVLQ